MRLEALHGVSFLLLLTAGAGAAVWDLRTLELPEGEDWVNGDKASAFERRFDDNSPIRELGVVSWGVVEYGLFEEGRPGVLIGADGWLFSDEEFAWHPEEGRLLEERLDLVVRVKERLAERGCGLVVALVPAKARIYQEQLGSIALPSYVAPRYARALEGLHARGVEAPDLVGPLREGKASAPTYLRTDTHWTPFGAHLAAQALGEQVRSAGLLQPSSRWRTERVGEEDFSGDLLEFLPLGPFQASLGVHGERLDRQRTVSADEGGGGGGLFDEVVIPVTVVGTSYTANGDWNFVGALQEALGADLIDAAEEGRGPVLPMLDYLDNPALEQAPPQLVVWEMPERSLVVVYDTEGHPAL